MAKQIVFFDIDGTLVDDQKQIPESAMQAIQMLKDRGVFVAIATGRAPFMFADIRKQLGVETFVSFNGQYVVHKGEVVFKRPLPKEAMFALETTATGHGDPMVFLSSEQMSVNKADHPFVEKSFADLKAIVPEEDLHFHKNNDIYQALLFCEKKNELRYAASKAMFDYIRWHDLSMDIVPSGGSKAKGIQHLINALGVDLENTFAFGDELNDIEMLSYVSNGVAMGNGIDAAKKAAKFVTKRVQDDGIYYGLQQVGLLPKIK